MGSFFAELKRRHIYRVAAAYALVAWVLLQLVNNLAPGLNLPDWAATFVIVLIAIGFPIALVFAWIHELKTAEAGEAKRTPTGVLDWALLGALVAVLGAVSYQQLAPSGAPATTEQREGGVEAARAAAASQTSAISLAVLPFANLSSDAEQEFFSDGMTEEITSAVAKIPDLRVVGRTSAFQFKGQNQDLRTIGQALAATHLLEGSVRKAGDRLRITAQLIKADDGTHIWTENYDRQLTDVFAIQEDIARAIATAMRMPLGLGGQSLVAYRPKDQETYDLYLRGRAAFRARRLESYELLQQVVERDPNFGPGWAYYARVSNAAQFRAADEAQRLLRRSNANEAARKAIALAPGYAGGYAALALLAGNDRRYLEALDLYKQAIARDADDPEVLNVYGNELWTLGYLKEALSAYERVHLLEPLIPIYNFLRSEVRAANGMLDDAVRDWLAVRPNVSAGRRLVLPAYAQLGRFNDAIDLLLQTSLGPGFVQTRLTQAQVDAAVEVLRAAANKTAPPAQLPDFEGDLFFVNAYTSTPERMLDAEESAVKAGSGISRAVWWPMPSTLRKTERFKTLVRNSGFVDIWRVRGWPDLCRPVGADDFTCE